MGRDAAFDYVHPTACQQGADARNRGPQSTMQTLRLQLCSALHRHIRAHRKQVGTACFSCNADMRHHRVCSSLSEVRSSFQSSEGVYTAVYQRDSAQASWSQSIAPGAGIPGMPGGMLVSDTIVAVVLLPMQLYRCQREPVRSDSFHTVSLLCATEESDTRVQAWNLN